MDKRQFIKPFIKVNPFEEYIIVDGIELSPHVMKYRAYHEMNTERPVIVEIYKTTVLAIEVNMKRIIAFIFGLQNEMIRLYDFLIEETSSPHYLNIF